MRDSEKVRAGTVPWLPKIAALVNLACLVLLVLCFSPGLAEAHANLVRSTPAANQVLDQTPTALKLWFSEAVDLRFTQVQLLDRAGQSLQVVDPLQADAGDPTVIGASLRPLSHGVYTISWRTASSVDGHITSGVFAFAVGPEQAQTGVLRPARPSAGLTSTGTTSAENIVLRWAGYLAQALLFGGFAFVPFIFYPSRRRAATLWEQMRSAPSPSILHNPTSDSKGQLTLPPKLLAFLMACCVLSAVVAILAAVVQAAFSSQTTFLAALGSPLWILLSGTWYGLLVWARLVLLLAVAALLIVGSQISERKRELPESWWFTGLAVSALVLLTTSLRSHAAADPFASLSIAADWLHLLASSAWLGGLVLLLLSLRLSYRLESGLLALGVSTIIGRFSVVASICVATLGITGFLRATAEVSDPQDLVDTPYGQTLLFKIGVIALSLGLAAVNLLVIRRRLDDAAYGRKYKIAAEPRYPRVRRTVGAEVFFVSAVLVATSVLSSLPPAREAFGPGVQVRGESGDLRCVLVVDPGNPGFNTFDLHLKDSGGRAVSQTVKVALIFSIDQRGTRGSEAVAQNLGDGHYLVQGGYLSLDRAWYIQVLVRRPGVKDVRIRLTFSPPDLLDQGTTHNH